MVSSIAYSGCGGGFPVSEEEGTVTIRNMSGQIEMFFVWCSEDKCYNRIGSIVMDPMSEVDILSAKCREHRRKGQ